MRHYARALASLARTVGQVMANNGPAQAEDILREYSGTVGAWARSVARDMLFGLEKNNARMFRSLARRMGMDMRMFLDGPGMGEAISKRIEENTRLICTIPLEAAKKAGELAHESLITGMRSEEAAKRLHELGGMSMRRARTIAHTETSKAYTGLTRVRAQSVGSEGYVWRTVRDGAIRPSHRAMEGRFVKWNEPPNLDGMTGHAGEFPNCRCYPEPVIPRTDGSTRAFFRGLPTSGEERESGKKKLASFWERSVGSTVVPHVGGQPLYNVERARFEPRKLTGYSMNANAVKPDGSPNDKARSKARAWKKWLDFTEKDAADIERQVMARAAKFPAIAKGSPDMHGERFSVYIPVTGNNGKTVDVMTAWIYDRNTESGGSIDTRPRLINCYIDGKIDSEGRYVGYKETRYWRA